MGTPINENPYLLSLGLELNYMQDGESELSIELKQHHTNSWQVMHGGITMTMLDAAMARAARSLVEGETSAATVEMKTSFFQPGGKLGQTVLARGRVLHQSTTLYYCEAEVINGDALIAKAIGTFKVFRRNDIARKIRMTSSKYLNTPTVQKKS